jgi:hypothetical protein
MSRDVSMTELVLMFPIGSWVCVRQECKVPGHAGLARQVIGYGEHSYSGPCLTLRDTDGVPIDQMHHFYQPCDPPADAPPCYGGTGGEP